MAAQSAPMQRSSFIKWLLGLPLIAQQAFAGNGASMAKKKVVLRFAVASDGHYGQPNTPYDQYFETLVLAINKQHLERPFDCCIINGDIIHDDITLLPMAKTALGGLLPPWYVSQGNHDHATPQEWAAVWGIPTNHVFHIGKHAFIIATTSDKKGTYLCPDTVWLEEALAKNANAPNVFVFLHINPGKLTQNAVDCAPLFEVFAKYKNIRAIFNGHDHDEEGMKQRNNLPFLFSAHFGGNWGTTYRGYRIVELYNDGSIGTWIMNPTDKINELVLPAV